MSKYTKIKLLKNIKNPYDSNSNYYLCYNLIRDLLNINGVITLEDLMALHFWTYEFYRTTLPRLKLDGLIELEGGQYVSHHSL